MNRRAVVNVATGSYVRGQCRLRLRLEEVDGSCMSMWWDKLPPGCPPHSEVPYAMKPAALREAAQRYSTLLWCDACIWPVKSLEPLWERIEREGYWLGANGFRNDEWCADSAYPDLFPEYFGPGIATIEGARRENAAIPHVVATAFGISTAHPTGAAILKEYCRLGLETRAFCGPWTNGPKSADGRTAPCGPPSTRGHRHDQAALSVIAWRLGCKLTSSPDIFAYGKAGDAHDERTLLCADGAY